MQNSKPAVVTKAINTAATVRSLKPKNGSTKKGKIRELKKTTHNARIGVAPEIPINSLIANNPITVVRY